jgi:hypothetical protein
MGEKESLSLLEVRGKVMMGRSLLYLHLSSSLRSPSSLDHLHITGSHECRRSSLPSAQFLRVSLFSTIPSHLLQQALGKQGFIAPMLNNFTLYNVVLENCEIWAKRVGFVHFSLRLSQLQSQPSSVTIKH